MLTMAVAASAFAACNKQETTPVVNEVGNKSIVLDIPNVLMTKSASEALEGGQVQLNDYQVFFADEGGTFYTPKSVTAEPNAETWFDSENTDTWATTKQFHFLPTEVNEVIVIGNYGSKITAANKTALTGIVGELKLDDENDTAGASNLALYGVATPTPVKNNNPEHIVDGTDPHPSPLYEAKVNLTPTVARFEVTGFEYAQVMKDGVAQPREYASMVVESVSIIDFYTEATVTYAGVPTAKTPYTFFQGVNGFVVNDDTVYPNYFLSEDLDMTKWWYDNVNVTLTGTTWANSENVYAYHTFPAEVPTFIVKLKATDAAGVTTYLYLSTKSLILENGEALEETEDAKIYKMYFKFDDDDISSAEKCISVSITVDSWEVVDVTPEF